MYRNNSSFYRYVYNSDTQVLKQTSEKHSGLKLCQHLKTYELTPWSRGLLEKLRGSQLVKKFHAFYGTRRLITAFTRAHHLPLS
jgi:hypothetical protein